MQPSPVTLATSDHHDRIGMLEQVVASMGMIAGSQAPALTGHGLTRNPFAAANVRWLALVETRVGALNGLVRARAVAVVCCLRFRTPGIAVIIGGALILILLAAVLTGAVLPTPVTGVIGLPG